MCITGVKKYCSNPEIRFVVNQMGNHVPRRSNHHVYTYQVVSLPYGRPHCIQESYYTYR